VCKLVVVARLGVAPMIFVTRVRSSVTIALVYYIGCLIRSVVTIALVSYIRCLHINSILSNKQSGVFCWASLFVMLYSPLRTNAISCFQVR